jgi:hypothetical protein
MGFLALLVFLVARVDGRPFGVAGQGRMIVMLPCSRHSVVAMDLRLRRAAE